MLADHIARPQHQPGRLALVPQMLGRAAKHGEGMHDGVFADLGDALDHHVRQQAHPVAQGRVRADNAIGADVHILAQTSTLVDQGGGMDRDHQPVSTTMAANSASAASLSPTKAWPLNLNTPPRERVTSTGMRNTSPGRTG